MLPISLYAQTPTDEELKTLERQIEQQEAEQAKAKRKAEDETKRKTAEEVKHKAEEESERIELEKQRAVKEEARKQAEETEGTEKRKKEEGLRAENEKKEKYDSHIQKAEAYMNEDKYNQAIEEYEQLLKSFPDDVSANEGIRNAQKFLNSCKEIIGSWRLSHGPTWVINNDNTADGTWLIFRTKGVWKCLSAREREFVVSWPDYGWIDYFKLSEDANTLKPIRDTEIKKISGSRIVDTKNDSTTNRQSQFGR